MEDRKMKVFRMTEYDTEEFMVGDQIYCGFGLATCQKVSDEGALFFTDDYDNEIRKRTGLIEYLNSEDGLAGFAEDVWNRLVPFGKLPDGREMLVRLPYAGEMLPKDEIEFLEDDDYEQLPLMKQRRNRVAYCADDWEWGWLMNHSKEYAAYFGNVNYNGDANYGSASNACGVRRAFLIK